MKKKTKQSEILKPSYQIFNDSCTKMKWPINADLFISTLPTSKKNGYSKGLVGFIANKAYYSLNNNSLAFVVVSSLKEDKTIPFEIVYTFIAAGFKYIDHIVWYKNKFTPTQGGKRLNNMYDFVFMFAKGNNYHLDRAAISYLKNNIHPDNKNKYICAGNLWFIKVDDKETLPYELIDVIIKLSNLLPNSLIIDPMMGHGTTCKVSLNCLHSFWGCETNKNKYKQCQKIIKEYYYANKAKSKRHKLQRKGPSAKSKKHTRSSR